MSDVSFTLQQKAFIMCLFRIEGPSASTSIPPITHFSVTLTSMQTKVQAIMNDISTATHSWGDHWNYVEYSPFSEEYQKASVSNKFNTLRFDWYDGTTDPDKHFLALMMIHNALNVELCCLFPNSLRDSALTWLASLAPWSIWGFWELSQKFRHHFMASFQSSAHNSLIATGNSTSLYWEI